jgi:hypothetical protein
LKHTLGKQALQSVEKAQEERKQNNTQEGKTRQKEREKGSRKEL